jgi:YggT family protein
MLITNLLVLVAQALQILMYLILIDVLISWASMLGARSVSPYHPWVRTLRRVTSPVMEPFRRIAPPHKMGGIDISPMLAIVAIQIVQGILVR